MLPAVEKAIKKFETEAKRGAFICGLETAIGVMQGTLYRLAGLEPEKKFWRSRRMYHVFKVVTPVGDNKWEFNHWHLFLSDGKEGICTLENCPNEFNCEDKTGWCRFLQVVDK